MFTAPAAWAGVVAVIEVLLTTVTLAAAVPPNVIVAPATKLVPVIVTAVPPLVEPEPGEIVVIVGTELPLAFSVTICMTHGPLETSVAVAP
jgi:hypothetical protein